MRLRYYALAFAAYMVADASLEGTRFETVPVTLLSMAISIGFILLFASLHEHTA